MAKSMIAALACAATMSMAMQSPQTEVELGLESALNGLGLSFSTARFDPDLLRMFRSGKYATPFYLSQSENPWRIPFFMDVTRRDLATYAGKPSDSLNSLARLVGFGTRRTLIGDPIAPFAQMSVKKEALGDVLGRMARAGWLKSKVVEARGVPPEAQQAAALLLNVAIQARVYRNLALGDIGDSAWAFRVLSKNPAAETDAAGAAAELAVYSHFRTNYMGAGGHDLVLAAQQAEALLRKVSQDRKYDWRVETVWGSVELCGGTSDHHSDPSVLLLLDTGGDDTYVGCPATTSVSNWCSIVIDTSGNDRYVSNVALASQPVAAWPGRKGGGNLPGPAGALMGYSILIDSQGDDLYRTHRPGLGSGRLGIGVLFDRSGNDRYDAYQDSEGFGMFGGGILEDLSGNDEYRGFTQVQGCGQTGGFGYLVDREGNDRYVADDQAIDFPSPQSAQHNVSMAQGAGNGRRADYLEGESLAGGIGILFDQQGDDTYDSAVFGQGVGYWMGVGALWDSDGNDAYHGMWYVQGAAAHFAIGYLEDQTGDDTYIATMNMAQGAGHDFSIGGLVDDAGNDSYRAPNLSLGAGNANGIGFFADVQGNDRYESSGITLGKAAEAVANTFRARALCLGVFVDLAGSDQYPAGSAWAKNGAKSANWTTKGPTAWESQLGVFMDR